MKRLEAVLVGATTLDRYGDDRLPGGSVLYGAAALHRLAASRSLSVRASVVTRFANVDRAQLMAAFDAVAPEATLSVKSASHTSEFANTYDARSRVVQWLHAPVPAVSPDPHILANAQMLWLAPVLHEIEAEHCVAQAPQAFVAINAQGFLRHAPCIPGPVRPRRWEPSPGLLQSVDAVFASEEDVAHQPELVPHLRRHIPLVVVTRGRRGAWAFMGSYALSVPALAVREIDPTGAGDTFAAVAAAHLCCGSTVSGALRVAARAAAYAVTRQGPDGSGRVLGPILRTALGKMREDGDRLDLSRRSGTVGDGR